MPELVSVCAHLTGTLGSIRLCNKAELKLGSEVAVWFKDETVGYRVALALNWKDPPSDKPTDDINKWEYSVVETEEYDILYGEEARSYLRERLAEPKDAYEACSAAVDAPG